MKMNGKRWKGIPQNRQLTLCIHSDTVHDTKIFVKVTKELQLNSYSYSLN
jgi:hypothetical protein